MKFDIGTKLIVSSAVIGLAVGGLIYNQKSSNDSIRQANQIVANEQTILNGIVGAQIAMSRMQLHYQSIELARSVADLDAAVSKGKTDAAAAAAGLDRPIALAFVPGVLKELQAELQDFAAAIASVAKSHHPSVGGDAAATTETHSSDQATDKIVASLSQKIEKSLQNGSHFTNKAMKDADDQIETATFVSLVLGALALLTLFGTAIYLMISIKRPLASLVHSLQRMAGGDFGVQIAESARGDEIGAVGRAVEAIKVKTAELAASDAERQRIADQRAAVERKKAMTELADSFERAVGGIVETVSSASTELNATAGAMTSSAAETSSQATVVASSAEEAAVNVAAVASATEEMGASINEIGRQVQHSAQMCEGAVVEARESAKLINELSQAAAKIGEVVSIISDIAGQTNLLALNATIEAARAGEAGRGFAVVATEVKQLAAQTAKATADISAQIEAIQNSTGRAVTAVDSIGETIAGLNATAGAISSAVSEQTAATQEIVHNVSQVSQGTANVTSTITGVARTAGETGAAASQVLTASGELSRQSEKLRLEMGRFLDTIRAA